jgi:predicted small metal-binding protein
MAYSYRCGDYPGMEACLASFTTETEEELWKHIEVHAATAHQEDPGKWSAQERQQMRNLIRSP